MSAVKNDSEDDFNLNGKRPSSEEAGGNRRKRSKPRKIARTHSSESVGGMCVKIIVYSILTKHNFERSQLKNVK